MNGRMRLVDRKNKLAELFWNIVNKIVLRLKFARITISGKGNIPAGGPFILVSNHISRWDGLLVKELVGRQANYMVSPNELLGFQGTVLRSMGAFPANPRYDLLEFVGRQAARGEGFIVFPEGNVFRDGTTHPFKNGAARLALTCASAGMTMTVVPMAIGYDESGPSKAHIVIGEPVELAPYVREYVEQSNMGIRSLTVRLEREVCLLRQSLGALADMRKLYEGTAVRKWISRGLESAESSERIAEQFEGSGGRVLPLENGSPERDRTKASA